MAEEQTPIATKLFGATASNQKDPNPPGDAGDASAKLDGQDGPNLTPAYGNQDGAQDRNVHLTSTDQLDSVREGSLASSANATQDGNLDMQGLLAAQAAGDDVPEGHEDTTQYSSFPIAALRIGGYQFEGGLLRLKNGDDADKFEAMLATADAMTQNSIKKIDREAGVAVAKAFQAKQGKMTQGIDHSGVGQRSPQPSQS